MKTIETTAEVAENGTLTVRVPSDIAPGPHRVVVVIDEQPAVDGTMSSAESPAQAFPVHDLGPWPEDLSLRREDMYDDWGR
jgi:hypothetical protein